MKCVKTCCLLFLFVVCVYGRGSLNPQADWHSWKLEHSKIYESEESEIIHREIWERNKAYVDAHNKRYDVQFKLGLNQFADQEQQIRPVLNDAEKIQINDNVKLNRQLLFQPFSWDWRKHGAVTPVENQGMMGESMAIVAAECVESYHFIKTGGLVDLSAPEAHDCCTRVDLKTPDIFGCIHNIGGLCSEAAYPQSRGTCRNDTCTAVAQVKGGKDVAPMGDENALLAAVLINPVMAGIDASHTSFQLYKSGVYSEPQCSKTRLDHAVQVVGYGSQDGNDYWICKNSWGASWGMNGYILIARNKGNMCGIATEASYPI